MLNNQIKFKLSVEVQVFLEDHENLKKNLPLFLKLVKWTIFSNFLAFLEFLNFIGRNNGVRESGNEEIFKDKRLKISSRHLCSLGQFNDHD